MDNVDWPHRWGHVSKILTRSGPFAHPDFEACSEMIDFLHDDCKVLIIGAGGLGCELLKDLALLGFRNMHVIDMDTIDLSNLNRQFLFRKKDIGKPKADVAAEFINSRIPGCKVIPHFAKIQDFDSSFYRQFHIIVCGLDSIIARRWINGMLVSLLKYNDDNSVDQSSIIPMVDGGTEGFKGNARVILPGMSACVECTLDLYPPQVNFPMCTIAHMPRLPEHCIEYVKVLLWPQEKPFGEGVSLDGDDPAHVKWVFDKASERANEYGISGVTYRLTQAVVKWAVLSWTSFCWCTVLPMTESPFRINTCALFNKFLSVVKRIIPAVASTNAVIAAACATEVFKLATSCCQVLSNYMNFNDTEGIYTYTFEAEKRENCTVCSQIPQHLTFSEDDKLQDIVDYLKENATYQLKSPGIITTINGKNKTLYMSTVKCIEDATKSNLKKTLKELGLQNGQELYVADPTTPNSLLFRLQLASKMDA